MPTWLTDLLAQLSLDTALKAARLAGVLFLGALVLRWVKRRLAIPGVAEAHQALVRRLVTAALFGVFAAWFLKELGFELGPLLGAAGVVTVAVGFAAQTSVSNLISGLFLMGERPFLIGDNITVGDKTGEVISIDLMSVRIRTFDNLLVRIPNETILKSDLINLTHFPIRRVDLPVGVAYKEDLGRVREILMRVAEENPLCLADPAPRVFAKAFGTSAMELQFSVWAEKTRYIELKNTIFEDIKAAFDAEAIEIPFPHISVYPGSVAQPLKIEMAAARPPGTQNDERI
jgi:small-conductance mechanosensitive channel